MVLFNATLLSTYLRPSALMNLMTGDLIDAPPASAQLGRNVVLLVSPQERGERTKTNTFDEIVILDDTRHPRLGYQLKALQQFVHAQRPTLGAAEKDMLPMWPFSIRDFLREWRAVVGELEFGK